MSRKLPQFYLFIFVSLLLIMSSKGLESREELWQSQNLKELPFEQQILSADATDTWKWSIPVREASHIDLEKLPNGMRCRITSDQDVFYFRSMNSQKIYGYKLHLGSYARLNLAQLFMQAAVLKKNLSLSSPVLCMERKEANLDGIVWTWGETQEGKSFAMIYFIGPYYCMFCHIQGPFVSEENILHFSSCIDLFQVQSGE